MGLPWRGVTLLATAPHRLLFWRDGHQHLPVSPTVPGEGFGILFWSVPEAIGS